MVKLNPTCFTNTIRENAIIETVLDSPELLTAVKRQLSLSGFNADGLKSDILSVCMLPDMQALMIKYEPNIQRRTLAATTIFLQLLNKLYMEGVNERMD